MRYKGKGIVPGYLCMLCDLDGMTKDEYEIHIHSFEHRYKQAKVDREMKEILEKKEKDLELLGYLNEIDPLD